MAKARHPRVGEFNDDGSMAYWPQENLAGTPITDRPLQYTGIEDTNYFVVAPDSWPAAKVYAAIEQVQGELGGKRASRSEPTDDAQADS